VATIHEGQQFWRWEAPGMPVAVDIALDVIDRIASELNKGLGAVPRRGVEVGGILLGSTTSGSPVVVTIRDYEAVPTQYVYGPSYSLSDGDRHAFQQTVEKWRFGPSELRPVGYFRSNTREEFEPDDQDYNLMDRFFPDNSHVMLLVRPSVLRAGTGTFFVRGGGPAQEFPFRSRDLTGREYSGRPARSLQHVTESVSTPQPQREAVPRAVAQPELPAFLRQSEPARSAGASRFVWSIFFLSLFLFGAAGGFFAARYWKTAMQTESPGPYALGLTGVAEGDGVLVRWNRDARPIQSAWRGVLTITEGEQSKSIQLVLPQLRNGSVLYRHIAPEIRFRLDVYLTEQNMVSESWTWKQPAP
jgi:hypothetical protein